ncbi:unnamed protein product [Cunninghamella blakesleeana]
MSKLIDTSPLKLVSHPEFGKIRQHKYEPLIPRVWSKETRLTAHMHFQFSQLELVLTKLDKLTQWNLLEDPLTKKTSDRAKSIAENIQSSWINYDMNDPILIKKFVSSSQINTLYPRASQYTLLSTNKGDIANSIQTYYQRMASLTQVLSACNNLLTTLKQSDRLKVSYQVAFLYQCINTQTQPSLKRYKTKIEQKFDDIKNEPEATLSQDQVEWITNLVNDVQSHILCSSVKDQHQTLRACSNIFDVIKDSTMQHSS